MASKQLGKLRQWAGEVISTRDRTTYTEEFKEVEKDIELRKSGAERLFAACESYHRALTKKKDSDALDDPEKLLPIDALGIVMIVHGEEVPEESIYGSSLLKLGRAHCKVATLQEAYALTFQDTFLRSVERFQEDVKEYEAHKKKLESRRLSYDAAFAKAEKAKSKKEKDKREAEEELELAKQRYEETLEDVRVMMEAIQASETELQNDLTAFLELEINFVEQYLAVMQEVKADWPTTINSNKRSPPLLKHAMSKSGSVRSKRSTKSTRSVGRATPVAAAEDSEDDSPRLAPALSRRSSAHGRSDSISSKPPSRPASRTSRKRSDSSATANGDKEKNDKSPKKLGVSGWVGWGKKTKDFSTLDGDEMTEREAGDNDKQVHHKASSSSFSRRFKDSLSTTSPKVPPRVLKTPSQHDLKTVRALYDFNGSSDELSFKVGDEIVVVNEVLEEWWMGELGGRKGLFPTSYTTVVPATQSRKPSPPLRNPLQKSPKTKRLSISSEEGAVQRPLIHDASEASELEDEEHILSGRLVSSASPFYLPGANNDSSGTEDDDLNDRVAKWKHDVNGGSNDSLSHAKATVETTSSPFHPQPPLLRRADTSSGIKKTPPPPPPPRRHSTNLLTSPPLPPRKPASTSSSSMLDVTPNASNNNVGYDVSPFESTSELAGCSQFRQNPFKPKGTCSNCFQFHHDF
ncbi:hypothetical protein PC9H_003301 [Pleurotus ostreatus]|uniref:BAR-domain-containing protein n=2 Tax=Pleurotus TaxID=5320 RepID=A0A8H6ZY52_PLEOS|nr:uncharacterized protein PC9H_003301 [Pleurotus ostreatus]KAF7436468.1 hypothetical protein PC9H_003301 [Pleurotus ostreatus]KAG9222473.1 hypothetical protein CCMSSC00406_0002808 [Pleurotus cornucopiae]